MKTLHYKPEGICAEEIEISIEDKIIKKVKIYGGCEGNRNGIASLVEGMAVEDVIARLEGIQCQNGTSCPDQLAKALKTMLSE